MIRAAPDRAPGWLVGAICTADRPAAIPDGLHRSLVIRAPRSAKTAPATRSLVEVSDRLTAAGETPGVGPAYPGANAGGVVTDDASRPLVEVLHRLVAFGPPCPAVNRGELERIN